MAAGMKTETVIIPTWINRYIFKNTDALPASRLMLLGTIWKLRHFAEKWNLADDYIKITTVELYEEYPSTFDDTLWEVDQYATYAVYHLIKDIE